jgi:heme-degrading monooxygenase HmoA
MSVMMGLRVSVDPDRFEEMANANRELMLEISEDAKRRGAIHHAVYANDEGGEILIVDEWPTKEAFLEFFQSNTKVPELMAGAGVTERPTPIFWRPLDTPDKF